MSCPPSRVLASSLFIFVACAESPRDRGTAVRDAGATATDGGGGLTDAGTTPAVDGGVTPVGPRWQTVVALDGLAITDIVGSGPRDVFVYGDGADGEPHLLHFDSEVFVEVEFPGGACGREIDRLASDGPGRLVALHSGCPNLMRFGPEGWTAEDPLPTRFSNARSVYASPTGRVFLAGVRPDLWEIPSPGEPAVEHSNPGRSLSALSQLGGTPDGVVWASGQGRTTYLDEEGWHPPEQGDAHFGMGADRVAGFADDDVWFLARSIGNVVCRIHDGERACFDIPTSANRAERGGLIVVAPGVAYTTFGRAAGDDTSGAERGSLHRLQDGVWHHLQAPADLSDLGPAFGAAPDDLWFASDDGRVLRYALPLPGATEVMVIESGPQGPEPDPEPAFLGGVNAAREPLRFCSSTGDTLVPSLPPGAHFGYVPVPIPAGGGDVLQFGVWVEPVDEPEVCRHAGVHRNRKTVFLNEGAVRTLVGYLDAEGEDQIEVHIDSFRAPGAGRGQVRIVNASLDRIDVCASGVTIDADIPRAAPSAFHPLPAGTAVLEVHDAATPACSGALRTRYELTLAARESVSIVAHPSATGPCLVAIDDEPSTPVVCGP